MILLSIVPCLPTYAVAPTLEILYKATKPAWIAIKNGEVYYTQNGWKPYSADVDKAIFTKFAPAPIQPGVLWNLKPKGVTYGYQIDTKDPTTIALWLNDPQSVQEIPQAGKPAALVPAPDKYWTFTPRKDIFVTLDSEVFATPESPIAIRPQTGTFKGLSGTSASGFSLKNNISESDIKQVK